MTPSLSLSWEIDEWPPGRTVIVEGRRKTVWFRDGDIVVLADGTECCLSSGTVSLVKRKV